MLSKAIHRRECKTLETTDSKPIGLGVARFFALRGWSPTYVGGVHWVSCGTGARWLMSLPDWAEPTISPREVAGLLRSQKMLALRYPSSDPAGIPAGLYVCREKNYSLNHVHGKRYVKAGLNRCEIRPPTVNELLVEGIECNRDTMRRQGRDNSEFSDPKRWKRFVEAAFSVPEIQLLGAFIDGSLAAYILSCLEDGWCSILYANSRTHLQEYHPNQALAFTGTRMALQRPDISTACMGPKRVLVDDGLDEHKIRMGYQLEPNYVVIRLHPALEGLMTSSLVLGPLRLLQKLGPDILATRRAEVFLTAVRNVRHRCVSRLADCVR